MSNPQDMAFSDDGLKVFFCDSGDEVNEYILATAYDTPSASISHETALTVSGASPVGMAFNTDGTKLFLTDAGGTEVHEYTVATGFDLSSTVTYG